MLILLVLSQLLPPQPAPPCEWREVRVYCERGCSCAEVASRLELARSELLANWRDVPDDVDQRVRGWRFFIAAKRIIPGPVGEALYGVTLPGERRVVLTWDMRAALHELVHVIAPGPGDGHGPWDTDGRMREIDRRYQHRFRSQPP